MSVSDLVSRPWFKWLAIIVGAVLFARFCLLPVLRRMRDEAKGWMAQLAIRHRDAMDGRTSRWKEDVSEAVKDRFLATASSSRHLPFVVRLYLKRLYKKLKSTDSRLKQLNNRVGHLQMSADDRTMDAAVISAALRDAENLKNQAATIGSAWLELIVAGFLTIAIVTANTGMLARILKETLNFSSSFAVLGIELQYVFALILTLAEVGVGFVFARFSAHSEERGDRLRVLPAFTLFITLLFSLFEGMNYSHVGSQAGSVAIPLVGNQVDATQIYFLFGFGIVWSLFLMGHLLAHGASRVVQGTAPKRLVKLLRLASHISATLPAAKQATDAGAAAAVDNVALDGLRRELDRISAEGSRDGSLVSTPTVLERPEVQRHLYQAGAWAFCAIAIVAVMLFMGVQIFTFLVPEIGFWAPSALAGGLAAACGVAGALWSANVRIYKADTEVIIEYDSWQRWAAAILMSLVVGTYLWGLIKGAGILRIPWTFLFILGASLAAAFSRLYPMLHLAILSFRRLLHIIATTAEWAFRTAVHLIYAIIVVMLYLTMILAAVIPSKRDTEPGIRSTPSRVQPVEPVGFTNSEST